LAATYAAVISSDHSVTVVARVLLSRPKLDPIFPSTMTHRVLQTELPRALRRAIAVLCATTAGAYAQAPIGGSSFSQRGAWQAGPTHGVGLERRFGFDVNARSLARPDSMPGPDSRPSWKLISIEGLPSSPQSGGSGGGGSFGSPGGGFGPSSGGGPVQGMVVPANVLTPHVAPEPTTWVLLGTGLLALAAFAAIKGRW